MPTQPARLAVAPVVVDQLAAVGGAVSGAWVQQALVDVALTAGAGVPGRTAALETADLVIAHAAVVTGAGVALVLVHLAKLAGRAGRTGAGEVVYQVVVDAAIAAGVWLAVIDVVLALVAHAAGRAGAREMSLLIVARRPVQTGIGRAGVGLVLAVGAPVGVGAVARLRRPDVAAPAAVLAQPGHGRAAVVGRDLARQLLHVAQLAGPAAGAAAAEGGPVLLALAAVLAGAAGAPVDQLVAVGAGEADAAVALVVAVHVLAGGAVLAWG